MTKSKGLRMTLWTSGRNNDKKDKMRLKALRQNVEEGKERI